MKKGSNFIKVITTKALICLCFVLVMNQNQSHGQEFHAANSMPTYDGGFKALKEFINTTLIYPEVAKKTGISGTVEVGFMVNKEGKVENVKVIRGISPECDTEAIRVTQLLKGWKPALRQGKPANTLIKIPVEFFSGVKNKPTVTGKITDKSTGLPLEGVFVIVKGTNIGSITNADGYYMVETPGEDFSLEYSSVGYAPKVEKIEKCHSINVELEAEYYFIDFNTQAN